MRSFPSAPAWDLSLPLPAGDDGPAVLWAVGDAADGGPAGRRVAERIRAARCDRLLYLGDVYETGTAEEFARHYDPLFGPLASVTAPTPGNHEWDGRAEGYDAYWTRVRGGPPPRWYAFEAGGWELLSLNSEEPCGPGSPQGRWLRGRLERPARGRLAFWHRPRLSAGTHGDQPDVAPLWDALRGRASIVLGGHEHNLQRLQPVDGLTQFVVGAGGRGHYALRRSWRRARVWPSRRRSGERPFRDRRLAFANDAHDGALRLELRPGLARFAFVAADGRILDAGAIAGHGLEEARATSLSRYPSPAAR